MRRALENRSAGELGLLAVLSVTCGRTPCRLLVVAIEDVLGMADQVNVPGTIDQHPNWRRRLPVSIDQMASAVDIAALKSATRERSRAEL